MGSPNIAETSCRTGGTEMTRSITNQHGTEIDFDAAVELMDNDLRESIHMGDGDPTGSNDRPGSEQQFFDWYSRLHSNKFGEEFEPNKRNPVW
jgi:hypothetical protein